MNKVNVFRIQHRPNAKKPYIVKWRVDGRDKSNAFRTLREAEAKKRKLENAKENGLPFSPTTGEPVEWGAGKITFAECVYEMSTIKSKKWQPRSTESFADAISLSIINLISDRYKSPNERSTRNKIARDYMVAYEGTPLPLSNESAGILDRLKKHSLPLYQIEGKILEEHMTFLAHLSNGEGFVANKTFTRRKQALHQALEYAYKKKYIKENPMDRVEFDLGKNDDAIKPERVLTKDECRELTNKVKSLPSEKYPGLANMASVFMSIIWLAGLRPSEVAGLKKQQVILGDVREIHVEKASVTVRSTSTRDGKSYSYKEPKGRAKGSRRVVPINDELAKILAPYVKTYKNDEFIFPQPLAKGQDTSREVRPVPTDTIASYFEKCRPSEDVSLYTLRHTNASILIAAGYNVIEVAKRLGHSAEVCMRIYAHIFKDKEGHDTSKEDLFLGKSKLTEWKYGENNPWPMPKPALKKMQKAAKKAPIKSVKAKNGSAGSRTKKGK